MRGSLYGTNTIYRSPRDQTSALARSKSLFPKRLIILQLPLITPTSYQFRVFRTLPLTLTSSQAFLSSPTCANVNAVAVSISACFVERVLPSSSPSEKGMGCRSPKSEFDGGIREDLRIEWCGVVWRKWVIRSCINGKNLVQDKIFNSISTS